MLDLKPSMMQGCFEWQPKIFADACDVTLIEPSRYPLINVGPGVNLTIRELAETIAEFAGFSSPYELPNNPEFVVNTGEEDLDEYIGYVIGELTRRGVFTTPFLKPLSLF